MEKPHKPELERRYIEGQYGEVVSELTPESERLWSDYLTKVGLYQRAIFLIETTKSNEE